MAEESYFFLSGSQSELELMKTKAETMMIIKADDMKLFVHKQIIARHSKILKEIIQAADKIMPKDEILEIKFKLLKLIDIYPVLQLLYHGERDVMSCEFGRFKATCSAMQIYNVKCVEVVSIENPMLMRTFRCFVPSYQPLILDQVEENELEAKKPRIEKDEEKNFNTPKLKLAKPKSPKSENKLKKNVKKAQLERRLKNEVKENEFEAKKQRIEKDAEKKFIIPKLKFPKSSKSSSDRKSEISQRILKCQSPPKGRKHKHSILGLMMLKSGVDGRKENKNLKNHLKRAQLERRLKDAVGVNGLKAKEPENEKNKEKRFVIPKLKSRKLDSKSSEKSVQKSNETLVQKSEIVKGDLECQSSPKDKDRNHIQLISSPMELTSGLYGKKEQKKMKNNLKKAQLERRLQDLNQQIEDAKNVELQFHSLLQMKK